ncbi:OB-fold nucleic acid binding domain-containing protein, partial [Kribbella sp.]|uniref:OB-fold nucleic acid binding domain-containing protein n=1 Tax=Kribbella sp. TaxID=1871183 RepID=UPI002D2A0C7F
MLGLYVSDHPLFGLESVLASRADVGIAQLSDQPDGAVVTIGGIISNRQRRITKKGDPWATATVEDLVGSVECLFFPATYQLVSGRLQQDAVVFVKGRLDKRDDVPRLIGAEVTLADLTTVGVVVLELHQSNVIPHTVNHLREVLTAHPGPSEVHLRVRGPEKTTVYRLSFRVNADKEFWADLKAEVAGMKEWRNGVS